MNKIPVFARSDGTKRNRGQIPNRPMKQSQVWDKLQDAFRRLFPTARMIRIEDQVGRGTPDVYYRMGFLHSAWLEIKTGYQKPTELQKAWHEAEWSAGGRVGVLIIRPNKATLDFGDGPEDLGVCTWFDIVKRL